MAATIRVGKLAKQTGLTVRTLHYYLGLLSPVQRSESGHRLYGDRDVLKLQQIASLRQLGFSLEEIRRCLALPNYSPQRVIERHIIHLREQIEAQRRLCDRLEALNDMLRSAGEISVEQLVQTIGAITMFEHYYTPEQLAELKGRSESLGPDGMRQAEADWQELIAAVRDEMDAGADPASERVQALAQRWNALVLAFTGGNPEIERSLQTMYQQEFGSGKPPTGAWQNKIDPRIMEYRAFISKAMEASQKP